MSGYKIHYKSITAFLLAAILCGHFMLNAKDAMADSEPRWVPLPDTPKALQRHFGMAEYNCYALDEEQAGAPSSGLENLIISHQFNPDFEQPGDRRTYYNPNILAKVDGHDHFAFGQCHTEEGALHCGIQCDGGPFQLFDVDMNRIILHNGGISAHDCEESEETKQLHLTPAKYGATFLLKRMDEVACKAVVQN